MTKLGYKQTLDHRRKISEFMRTRTKENHPAYKGNNVNYTTKHRWISEKLGKPHKCENCDTTTALRYEWANISGEYRRDESDWVRLCKRCHCLIDNITNKGWTTRKGKNQCA